jgi:hypothetical protein
MKGTTRYNTDQNHILSFIHSLPPILYSFAAAASFMCCILSIFQCLPCTLTHPQLPMTMSQQKISCHGICPASLNELHGYWALATRTITGVAAPFSIGRPYIAALKDLEYEHENCSLLSYNVLNSCMHGTLLLFIIYYI